MLIGIHICRFYPLRPSSDSVIDSLGDTSRIVFTNREPSEDLPVSPHALIISHGLNPTVRVQPVTRQAYAALASFPANETGAINVDVADFEAKDGPIAALDSAGLSTMTMG